MKHHIDYPTEWPLLEEFHNFLWKMFPMDRFEFSPRSQATVPAYVETVERSSAHYTLNESDDRTHYEDVNAAVRNFVQLNELALSS